MGDLERIYKRWQSAQGLSQREMILLVLDLMAKREMRPRGWFTIRYQPVSIGGEVERILVVPLPAIGDTLCTLPTLCGLKERFNGSSLSVLIEEGSQREILRDNPMVDELILFSRGEYLSQMKDQKRDISEIADEMEAFIEGLKRRKFDLLINLHITSWSAFITYLTAPKHTFGLTVDKEGRSLVSGNMWMLYYHYIYLNPLMNRKTRVNFTELLGRASGVRPWGHGVRWYGKIERCKIKGLRGDEVLFGLCAGGPPYRRWPPERFARLGDILSETYKAKILLFGRKGETGLNEYISSMMNHKPINLCGSTSLSGLASVLKRCKCLITNDTGPMHIAGALGVPVVGIFAPSYKELYAGADHIIIKAASFDSINVDMVLAGLKFLMRETFTVPNFPGIKFYYPINKKPKRFFSYTLLNKDRIDLEEKILGASTLNLWIKENNGFEPFEELLSTEDIEEMLERDSKIEDLTKGIKGAIECCERYERMCEEGIGLLEEIYSRSLSGGNGLEIDLIKSFNRIDKEMGRGVGEYLSFLYFLFLRSQHDEMGWRLNLYRARREACIYLRNFLRDWKRRYERRA
jgi:ADP-heptose:LPS heptosyltransferase